LNAIANLFNNNDSGTGFADFGTDR